MALQTMKELLLHAAEESGKLLLEMFGRGIAVEYKGASDLVTEADRRSEAKIVSLVRERFPEHDILAEEGDYAPRGGEVRWIIDPLDGTTNYAHGHPWFAVSIAVEVRGELVLGVVSNPCLQETFFAERGCGATVNDKPARVSSVPILGEALLATGFAYDHKVCRANNYDYFNCFQLAAQACRRPGVASLDLASIAAGRFDGFWEMKLKPWDLAAGVLLVEEAGGRVSDFDGQPMSLDGPECLASNGLLHPEMLDILRQGCRPRDDLKT